MSFADKGTIETFKEAMGRIPLLTAAEEITLGTAIQLGLSEDATPGQKRAGQRAKSRMMQANIRLVLAVAKKHLHRNLGQLELADLVQEGCIGLNRACEKFNPELGYKFSTYSYWCIRQSISRAVDQTSSTIRVPTTMNLKLAKLNQLPKGLLDQEICEELEISLEQLKNLRKAQLAKSPASLETKVGSEGDGSCLSEFLADERTTLDIDKFQWEIVRESLEVIVEFDQKGDLDLLRRNLVDGTSLQALAKEEGISREHLRQRLNSAKRRLASRMIEHRELVA